MGEEKAKRALPLLASANERPDLCGPCGGTCCQNGPGWAAPEDFGAPDEKAMRARLRDELATGRWNVDYWYGDPRPYEETEHLDYLDLCSRIYFVRPATVDTVGFVRSRQWPQGRCTFHTSAGCEHEVTKRPRQCRALVPAGPDGPCREPGGGWQPYALAWMPYQGLLLDVVDQL